MRGSWLVVFAMGCASRGMPSDPAPTPQNTATHARGMDAPLMERVDVLDHATRLYRDERYREAAVAFRHAYDVLGAPEALFAEAQALRLAGDCAAAATLYATYFELQSDPTAAGALRPLLDDCQPRFTERPRPMVP